jgi:hypothetical protein
MEDLRLAPTAEALILAIPALVYNELISIMSAAESPILHRLI